MYRPAAHGAGRRRSPDAECWPETATVLPRTAVGGDRGDAVRRQRRRLRRPRGRASRARTTGRCRTAARVNVHLWVGRRADERERPAVVAGQPGRPRQGRGRRRLRDAGLGRLRPGRVRRPGRRGGRGVRREPGRSRRGRGPLRLSATGCGSRGSRFFSQATQASPAPRRKTTASGPRWWRGTSTATAGPTWRWRHRGTPTVPGRTTVVR